MDADVSLIGLQVSPDLFENSFYLFNHQLTDKSCSTTFSIKVLCFLDMYDGPAHEKIRMGSRECPGKCLTVDNFERCDAPCKNAIARLIMALIIDRYGNARTGHSADNTADSAERRSQPHSTVR